MITMKKHKKTNYLFFFSLFLITGLISILLIQNENIPIANDKKDEFENSAPIELLSSANYWDNFSVIHINGNWSNGVNWGWIKGSGTFSDPWVIENITISAGASFSGIVVENNADYFVINNCSISKGTTSGNSPGIKLEDCGNGTITNCYLNDNYYGIWMNNTSNCTISGNRIQGNDKDGIYMKDSTENVLKDNIIKKNTENGLFLVGSDYNQIIDLNIFDTNTLYGIHLDSTSDYNQIVENYIGYNVKGCIKNEGSNNNLTLNDCVGDYEEDPVYGELDEEAAIPGFELGIILVAGLIGSLVYYSKKIKK